MKNRWLRNATAFARADFRAFLRNREAVFWTFFFPIFFMVLLGLVFGNAQVIDLKVGVVNADSGEASANLTQLIDGAPNVRVEQFAANESAAAALTNGDINVYLVIPADYTARVASSQSPNGSNGTPPAVLDVYFAADTTGNGRVALTVVVQILSGVNNALVQTNPVLVPNPHEVQVTKGRYIDYLVPGIIGMTLMFNGVFAIAGVMTTMRQKGILRRLKVTPVSKSAILAALITTRMVITFLGVLLILLVGVVGFGVSLQGNPIILVGLIILGSLSFTTFGFAVSSYAKTIESAESMANVVTMPMMFLGDVFLPVALMPAFMQPIAGALPLRYLTEALRDVGLNGAGLVEIVWPVLGVLVWGTAGFFLAVYLFRWE
ncbi:MAG TPA: ABC transporter permease [Candidatus Thermoplasmatota archaeon]|nr:ABC transporter permease [Candidatus Thermoplasmatota archaeon]